MSTGAARRPKWVGRPQGTDLKQWWQNNHVLQSFKRPQSSGPSRPSTAASSRMSHQNLPATVGTANRPATAMAGSASRLQGGSAFGFAGSGNPVAKAGGGNPISRSNHSAKQRPAASGQGLVARHKDIQGAANTSVIQDAKASALQFAHATFKPMMHKMSRMKYIDDFLYRAFEYMSAHLQYSAARAVSVSIEDSLVLHTEHSMALFSAAFYKLMLEANRAGEQNLTASALHCPWQQYLFKLVEATLTHKFDKCAGAEVHAELSRVLPSHTFVLAADEGNSQEHHHKYEQAILRLGGLTAAQEVRPLADAVRASVMEILPADACVFFLVDEGTSELWDEKYGKETGVGHSRRPLGCGIAGLCGQSCQLINVDAPPASDATRDPRYAAEVDRVGHGSNPMYIAAVPLITTRGTCSGVLQVYRVDPTDALPFEQSDITFLEGFASKVADAVDGAIWRTSAVEQGFRQTLQLELAKASVTANTAPQWATEVARCCKESFEVQGCTVWVVYEGSLRRVGSDGIEGVTEPAPLLCNDIGNFAGICGHCLSISVGRVIMSNDVEALGGFDPEIDHEMGFVAQRPNSSWFKHVDYSDLSPEDTLSWEQVLQVEGALFMPLFGPEGQGIGVLKLMNKQTGDFGAHDEKLALEVQSSLSQQLAHMQAFEKSIADQKQHSHMLELGCELMSGTALGLLVERVMMLCSERLKCEDFALLLSEEHSSGQTRYNKMSMNHENEMKTVNVPTGLQLRLANPKAKQTARKEDGLLGIAGQVFRNGELHCTADPYKDQFFDPKVDRPERIGAVSSILSVPISQPWQDGACTPPVAVLQAYNKIGGDFNREDENFFRALAPVLCTAIGNVSSHEQAAKTSQDALRLLNTVGSILDATSVASLCDQVREMIPAIIEAQRTVLWVHDPIRNVLSMIPGELNGKEEPMIAGKQIDLNGPSKRWGIAGHAFMENQVSCVEAPERDSRWFDSVDSVLGYAPRQVLSIPVRLKPKSDPDATALQRALQPGEQAHTSVGILQAVNKLGEPGIFGSRDEQLLLEAAGFIAPVINSLVTKAADSIQFSVSSAVMDRAFEAFTELPEFKFDQANEAVRKMIHCELVQMFVWQPDSETLRVAHEVYSANPAPANASHKPKGLLAQCIETKAPVLITNCDADENYCRTIDQPPGCIATSLLLTPVLKPSVAPGGEPELLGVLLVANKLGVTGFGEFDQLFCVTFSNALMAPRLSLLKNKHDMVFGRQIDDSDGRQRANTLY